MAGMRVGSPKPRGSSWWGTRVSSLSRIFRTRGQRFRVSLLAVLTFSIITIFFIQTQLHSSLPLDSVPLFQQTSFFFAMNFFNNEEILPNFIQEFERLVLAIGVEKIFLSVYENDSADRTKELLTQFKQHADSLGVPNIFWSEDGVKLYSKGGGGRNKMDRIEYLAGVRNKALKPLYDVLEEGSENKSPWHQRVRQHGQHIRVVFMNDIYYKASDILRLISTRGMNYDIACAMDFYWSFYDSWVTRDLNGDHFHEHYPYVSHPASKEHLRRGEPFEVISCWNGAIVMDGAPFLKHGLRVHGNPPGYSCYHSECYYVCRDFEMLNYTRIYVNPQVRVAYHWKYYFYQNRIMPLVNWLIDWVTDVQPEWSSTQDPAKIKYNPLTGKPLDVFCGS